MGSDFKLTYFGVRGRGELPRLLFAARERKFEDVRIKQEDWPTLKPETVYGSLPFLEYKGVTIGQSLSVARFVAKELGLAGRSTLEQALTDGIVDSISDLMTPLFECVFEKDEEAKAEKMTKFKEDKLTPWLKRIESFLVSKKYGDGNWLVGDQMSWADIAVFNWMNNLELMGVCPSFSLYPAAEGVNERVAAVPGIAKWLKERPETPM